MEPVTSLPTTTLVPALVDTAVSLYGEWTEQHKGYEQGTTKRATRTLQSASARLDGAVQMLQTMWSLFGVDYSAETVRAIIRQQYESKIKN